MLKEEMIGLMEKLKKDKWYWILLQRLQDRRLEYINNLIDNKWLDFDNRYSNHDVYREAIKIIEDILTLPDQIIIENTTIDNSIWY